MPIVSSARKAIVQHPGQASHAATQIDDTHVGRGLNHFEQVVERLFALGEELGVLGGIPGVGHGGGKGKRGAGSMIASSAAVRRLCTLTPSNRTGRLATSVLSSNSTARATSARSSRVAAAV